MTGSDQTTPTPQQIVVDVAGLQADMPLGDLTVEQFIQLLSQLLPQIPVRAKASNAAKVRATFEQVRDLIERSGSDNRPAILEAVRDTQAAILRRMPELLDESISGTVTADAEQ